MRSRILAQKKQEIKFIQSNAEEKSVEFVKTMARPIMKAVTREYREIIR